MTASLIEPPDTAITSFRQQASIFSLLNLFVIGVLLFVHLLLTPYWGRLSPVLLVALGLGFLFHAAVFMWIQARPARITRGLVVSLTVSSITVNSVLTFVAAATNHEDSQYFALMIIPILEAAFRFSLSTTIVVVAVADALNFYWVWQYYRIHPSQQFNEYIEAGTVSMIYTLVGLIVWLLVKRLKQKELYLARNAEELAKTRKHLLEEEKLAAVGRLSSAIAHEIRNPVAMISSSLSMADENGVTEAGRKEMLDIATKEAKRLERLTGNFLEYARPQLLEPRDSSASDTLLYVASACKAYASETGVRLDVDVPLELNIRMDAGKVQQALMNLVKNAVEASESDQTVTLRGLLTDKGTVWLEVHNAGPPIPKDALRQIFEPFFTTKQQGTGLGLAIARNIARAHGGDLFLRVNEPGRVCFTLELPATVQPKELTQERTWAGS
jgi:two-component system sensor histidine kinase HydH